VRTRRIVSQTFVGVLTGGDKSPPPAEARDFHGGREHVYGWSKPGESLHFRRKLEFAIHTWQGEVNRRLQAGTRRFWKNFGVR
jgi:hypothetical protein